MPSPMMTNLRATRATCRRDPSPPSKAFSSKVNKRGSGSRGADRVAPLRRQEAASDEEERDRGDGPRCGAPPTVERAPQREAAHGEDRGERPAEADRELRGKAEPHRKRTPVPADRVVRDVRFI